MGRTRRLFIALPFGRDVVDSLSDTARLVGSSGGRVKGVKPDQYHITVKFLGGVDESLAEKLIAGFNSLSAGTGGIPFAVRGLGAFPSLSRASVLWAGVSPGDGGLASLFGTIEEFSAGLGFARETREFRPHLTLGRVRRGEALPDNIREHFAANKDTPYCESVFDRLVLFESELGPRGPLYTAIAVKEL